MDLNNFVTTKVVSEDLSSFLCQCMDDAPDDIWETHSWTSSDSHDARVVNDDDSEYRICFENQMLPYLDHDLFGCFLDEIRDMITEYIKEFGNDTWNMTGFSQVRFSKCLTNSKMRRHVDHIYSVFDGNVKGIPVLTLNGVLNDGFKGGAFVMNGQKYMLKSGETLLFPSNFLYPHEVETITSGVRYHFVTWVY